MGPKHLGGPYAPLIQSKALLVIYQKRGGLLHKPISCPSLHIFLYDIILMFSHGFFLRDIRKLTTVHYYLLVNRLKSTFVKF